MAEPAVLINNLEKTYHGRVKKAVDGLNLRIEQGDFFGLLGPNGAGKSTTLNILSQLILKDKGQISVMGFDLDTHPFEVKNSLGIVPQEFNFNMFETPYQIVMQQGGYYGFSSRELKSHLNMLFDRLDLHPHAHRPSRTLSGGMKRRLMVARGLIHRPSILILDEPTAGVDVQLRLEMWDFLKELNAQGTTIILTSHYLEEIEILCPNVGIIDKGVLLSQTKTSELTGGALDHVYEIALQHPLEDRDKPALQAQGYVIINETLLRVSLSGEKDLHDVFRALAHLKITSVKMVKQRLEDVFLNLIKNNKKESV